MILVPCVYRAVRPSQCPSSELYRMQDCHRLMSNGEFCEADQKLPDGNPNYEINNCEQQGFPEIFDVLQLANELGKSMWFRQNR